MDKDTKIRGKPILDVSLPRIKTAGDELPTPDRKRWTPRHKVSVVAAVLRGVIDLEEVCRRCDLSVEEFLSWRKAIDRHDVQGLHTTKLQKYRYGTATERLSNPPDHLPRMGLRQRRAPRPVQSTNLEILMRPLAVADKVSTAREIRGPAPNRQSTIRTGDLVVDLEARVLSVHDKPVPLTSKEYCICELFSLRKDTVVTKQMLLDHLYGGMDEPNPRIINVFVCHLRKKLAQATAGKHYIETVWGRGYRLCDPAGAIGCA
jgi:DNA-binding winged helix-turn-helix (wHTH) protein/transposase-like protein